MSLKIIKEIDDLDEFESWGPAQDTQRKIVDADLGKDFVDALADIEPDGIDETKLNDVLAYDSEWALSLVGLSDEDEENDDEDF